METVYCFLIPSFVLHVVSCIPVSEFYPFGLAVQDHNFPKNDDGSSPRVNISTLFPFFNSQHDSLYVNTNGAISFQKILRKYTPAPFPLNDHRSIVAPFWADVDIRNGGTVWYRETTAANILQRATNEIRLYNPDQLNFHANWVSIATWDNVAFYGASTVGRTKTNTFQAVLITNGRHSFAVFNYAKITWTTGTASNGSAYTGLGGTPAQVGFDGGDGVNFYALPASRTPSIVYLPRTSNVKTNGKFIFRIDTAKIENSGCSTGGKVVVYPFYITMYGGQEITVSGPCFSANDTVQIIFSNNDSQSCVRRSDFSVRCLTPIFYVTGVTNIVLQITSLRGQTSHYTGRCTVVNPLLSEPGLVRVLVGAWVRGKRVTVQWTPDNMPFTESHAKIEVYSIKPNDAGQPRFILEKTLASSVLISAASTSFIFDVETTVVILKMTEVGNNMTLRHSVWSDAFVVKPNMDTKKGQEEAKDTCQRQLNSDIRLPPLTDLDIQTCPCRAEQIEIDLARFRPDPLCKETKYLGHLNFRTSRNCQQAEAQQCYRLNSPGPHGSGRLCCYDYRGNLMDAKSASGGGTAHRFHYFGGPGSVPYLSTLVFDTSPYFHCCKYIRETAGLALCARLLQGRPQGDCKNYQPIKPARLIGDSHFNTLDGLPYTFNGVGEFILLKHINNTFSAQVRMEQVAGPDGTLRKASVITSFSAKRFNMSDTVEVRLNSIRVADVLINGEIVDFTHYRSLHFNGVSTTMTERNSTDRSLKQINVIFIELNLAFRILAYRSLLNVIVVSGSDSLQGKITGLLGNYNGYPDDDLTTEDGHVISRNSTARDIQRKFGLTWRVERQNSLFTYPNGQNYLTFQNVAFTPMFPVPAQTFSSEARDICGHDEFCLYDYYATGRTDIASATRAASQTFKSIQMKAEPVIVCSQPLDVAYGYWNSTGLVVNSTAVLICEEGRRPNTSDVISCKADRTWKRSNDACIEIRCGALPIVPYGRWSASNYTVGANATLHCDVGSNLKGSGMVTCDEVGMWNPTGQACDIVDCGPLPSFPHGQWVSTGTTFGHTAILECDEGTKSVGSTDVQCGVNGTWDIGAQTCTPIDCGYLPSVTHGHWIGNVTLFGHTAELVCEEGRQPSGVANVTCGLSGEWNISSLTCDLVRCRLPTAVRDGYVGTGSNFNCSTESNGTGVNTYCYYGTLVQLGCQEGRTLGGNNTSTICMADGKWSHEGLACYLNTDSSNSQTVGVAIGIVIGVLTAGISLTCTIIIIVVIILRRRTRKISIDLKFVPECDKNMKINTSSM